MGRLRAAADALVDQLVDAGIVATADPSVAAANRPCVLVTPPAIDYTQRTDTWRLAALSSHPAGTLAAVDELDQLLDQVEPVLYVEAADPASYALTAGTVVPAYLIRVTTSH